MNYVVAFSIGGLLLALAGCGGSSSEITPAPDVSQVMFVHASYPQAPTALQFTADNTAAASVAVGYGQTTGYITFTSGSHSFGANGLPITTARLDKNQSYTLFAYGTSATGTPSNLLANDDLTAPTVGQARLRLVNLTANVGNDVKVALAITSSTGTTTYKDLTPIVSANSFSAFTDFTPATTSLVLLDASNNVLAQIGNGGGTGVFKYQSGKLYTIVAAGDKNATSAVYQPKAFIISNN